MARVKVMIAHKNLHTASQLAKTLIKYGYEVSGAVSTEVGALLMAERIPLDLILMGIMLKGPLDGITTAEIILSRTDLPIVYLAPNLNEELITPRSGIILAVLQNIIIFLIHRYKS